LKSNFKLELSTKLAERNKNTEKIFSTVAHRKDKKFAAGRIHLQNEDPEDPCMVKSRFAVQIN